MRQQGTMNHPAPPSHAVTTASRLTSLHPCARRDSSGRASRYASRQSPLPRRFQARATEQRGSSPTALTCTQRTREASFDSSACTTSWKSPWRNSMGARRAGDCGWRLSALAHASYDGRRTRSIETAERWVSLARPRVRRERASKRAGPRRVGERVRGRGMDGVEGSRPGLEASGLT